MNDFLIINEDINKRKQFFNSVYESQKFDEIILYLSYLDDINHEERLMRMISNYKLNKFDDALSDCSFFLRNDKFLSNYIIPTTARVCMVKMQLSKEKQNEFWVNSSNVAMRICYEIAQKLKNSNQDKVTTEFRRVLDYLELDDKTKENWEYSFDILINITKGKYIQKYEITEINYNYNNILFCNGMGWSGSGAVIDFFKNFQNVKHYSFEFQQLNGAIKLLENSNDKEIYKNYVVDYFFKYIFGFYSMIEKYDYKSLFSAQFFQRQQNYAVKYSYYAVNMMKIISSIFNYLNNDKEFFSEMNLFIKSILRLLACDASDENIIIFDNMLQNCNFKLLEHLKNFKIFYVVRDPRSNYVELVKSCKGYDKNVSKFIDIYKKKRSIYKNIIKAYDNIEIIKYDEFVACDIVRDLLQNTVGLNTNKYTNNKFFNAGISIQNVENWMDYENKNDINVIYKELHEYCIDL